MPQGVARIESGAYTKYVSISIHAKAHISTVKLKGHPAMLGNAEIGPKMGI
jgi:hypothetical protein